MGSARKSCDVNYDDSYPSICAQVNSAFQVGQLMQYVNWHPDKIVRNGDIFLAYCPIHRDEVFRTLALNPRNNTYQCRHVNCAGHHPADFLDLLQKLSNKPLPEVILDAAAYFTPQYFRLTDRQIVVLQGLRRPPQTFAEK